MNTKKFFKDIIYKWVKDNFGQSEADDPSWSIDALAEELEAHSYAFYHNIDFENEKENVKFVAEQEGIDLTEQELKDATNEYMESDEFRSIDDAWETISHYINQVKGE